jgi:hypothetical protein
MRRTATVLVLVVGMALSARAAESAPISFPAFIDPCFSSGSSTCPASTDSPTETSTFDGVLTNTVLSTFNTDGLTQPLNDVTSYGLPLTVSLNLSLDSCDTSHPCTPTVVPEPASIILFGTGLTALATRLRPRRRRQDA